MKREFQKKVLSQQLELQCEIELIKAVDAKEVVEVLKKAM
jgi:hypothetical protein